jgi:hypothetical protein
MDLFQYSFIKMLFQSIYRKTENPTQSKVVLFYSFRSASRARLQHMIKLQLYIYIYIYIYMIMFETEKK